MNELDNSFVKLLGRQPSDAERQNLYKVRDALCLKENDALWLILIALQYHQNLYEKIPSQISENVDVMLRHVVDAANRTIRASAEVTKADLAKAVAQAANEVAHSTAHKKRAQWIAACATITVIIIGSITPKVVERQDRGWSR